MSAWGWAAVLAGAAFTTGVVYFAVMRVPQWRRMEIPEFLSDFERVINVADKVQPMFLALTIVSAAMLVGSAEGASRILVTGAIAGFVVTLFGSLAFLVPLQRKMIALGSDSAAPLPAMRARWLKGHIERASLAVTSFAILLVGVLVVR